MEKHITPVSVAKNTFATSSTNKSAHSISFQEMLKGRMEEKQTEEHTAPARRTVMLVGEISRKHQTVSELLMQNPELRSSSWQILSAEQNRDKDYRTLKPGTQVYYNSTDGSLTWSSNASENPERSVGISSLSDSSLPKENNVTGKEQLGVISNSTPTVSHLLHSHPRLKKDTWNILAAAGNKDKDFSQLAAGTQVVFDHLSGEITWQQPEKGVSAAPTEVHPVSPDSVEASTKTSVIISGLQEHSPANRKKPLLLGVIDNTNTTVSHLLAQHSLYGRQTYEILANAVNQDKPFNQIPLGTPIYLNPKTLDITWNRSQPVGPAPAALTARQREIRPADVNKVEPEGVAANLTEAVQPYLGTSYHEIDCYELLVKGLDRMDIPYGGKNGLFTKLTTMARDKGMPVNAYLNGEGIVKAAGSLVYSKSYSNVVNWQEDAEMLFGDIEPLLDKGQILSFSTQSRGHTGIVSQQGNQWTFINSGRQDNPVAMKSVPRGVGEEILHKEIRNWFKLAHSKNETLMVTLGQLEQDKIRTASHQPQPISNRI